MNRRLFVYGAILSGFICGVNTFSARYFEPKDEYLLALKDLRNAEQDCIDNCQGLRENITKLEKHPYVIDAQKAYDKTLEEQCNMALWSGMISLGLVVGAMKKRGDQK